MGLRVGHVVGRVAWPQMVPYQNSVALRTYFLRAEGASDLLVACLVQKVISEDTVVLLKALRLQMVLDFPEVNVVLNEHRLLEGETAESVINSDFVLVRQLDGSFGHNTAVVLNSVDGDLESVHLGQVARDEGGVGVFFFSACERVLFFGRIERFGLLVLAGQFVGLNPDVDFVGLASEHGCELVEFVVVLIVHLIKGFEVEVSRGRPEETLGWELVLVRVNHADADVVVVLDALHAAPELKFFEGVAMVAVEQPLDSIF